MEVGAAPSMPARAHGIAVDWTVAVGIAQPRKQRKQVQNLGSYNPQ